MKNLETKFIRGSVTVAVLSAIGFFSAGLQAEEVKLPIWGSGGDPIRIGATGQSIAFENVTDTNSWNYAIVAQTGQQIVVEGSLLDIQLKTESDGNSAYATAIHTQNNTVDSESMGKENVATVIVNAAKTVINVQSPLALDSEGNTWVRSIGLAAMSNGHIVVNGDLEVTAEDAISVRGYAQVDINAKKDKTVVLNGNIDFNYNKPTSDTTVDALVNLNLSNKDSYWTGRVYATDDSNGLVPISSESDFPFKIENGVKLGLSNGGTWNVTGNSFVNTIQSEGGVLNLQEKNSVVFVTAYELSGEGNELRAAEGAKLTSYNDGKLTINFEDATLTSDLGTMYVNIQRDEDKVVTGTDGAAYDTTGKGSLVISDAFTYSSEGLASLIKAYSGNEKLTLSFKNASLKVVPTETVKIEKNISVDLVALGEGKDVIGGGTVSIEEGGTVNVVAQEDGETKAVLGKAVVQGNGKLGIYTETQAATLETKEGGLILVGDHERSGKLIVKNFNHKGAMFLDPTWESGVESSEAAITLAGNLDGQILVGQNSKLAIGASDTTALDAALQAVGKSIAQDSVKAAAYINAPVTLGSAGAIAVDGTKDSYTAPAAGVTVAAGSALIVNAEVAGTIITGAGGAFNAETGSYLIVDKAVAGQTVNVAEGFGTVTLDGELMATNRALALTASGANEGKVIITAETNLSAIPETLAPNLLTAVAQGAAGEGAGRLNALLDIGNGLTNAQVAAGVDKIALMGTASGAQTISVTTSGMIADAIEEHGSRLAAYVHNDAASDLWINVNGFFSKADNYRAGSKDYGYKSDLWGVTFGGDYAFGNGAAAGLAFSIGNGSVRGQGAGSGTKNDLSYYGLNLYGVWNTPYANLIGSIGYQWTKNEIKQSGFKGKPDVGTFSIAVRAEKTLQVTDAFAVTPHIGVRYMNVDMDSFNAGGFKYSAEKANLFQIPVGVAVNGQFKAPCDAEVKPFLDLTVNPTMGDKKVTNKVALLGTSASDSIDAQIANAAMFNARVGLEANRGAHSLGLNYRVGAGNRGRVDQALQAKYRFSF